MTPARGCRSALGSGLDDQGPGPPPDVDAVGFASTKPRGLGVGLLLTQASLEIKGNVLSQLPLENLARG